MVKNASLVIVGIDLAGSPKRPTGLRVLRDLTAETHVVFSDEEILPFVDDTSPQSTHPSACPKAGALSMIVPVSIYMTVIKCCFVKASAFSLSRWVPCAC